MASHHCHCHCHSLSHSHRHYQTESLTPNCCCSSDYSPPPPSLLADQLLQVIGSYPIQSNPNPTFSQIHHSRLRSQQLHDHTSKYQHKQRLYQHQEQHTLSIIACLLHRVEALESSLSRYQKHSLESVRDAAACVIQNRFRAFLVRRSRTLSELKDLAFIKSTVDSLKSLISRDTHVDFGALSRKLLNLLLQLDSIQGDDPLIHDGKRSITRDLIQFLDLINGVVVKSRRVSVKTMKSTGSGHNFNKAKISRDTKRVVLDSEQRKMLNDLRQRVERINRLTELSENDGEAVGFEGINDFDEYSSVLGRSKNGVSFIENGLQGRSHEPKVKKCVTFAGNGDRMHGSTEEPICSEGGACLDGSDSINGQGEFVKNLTVEAVEVTGTSQGSEDDEEAILENGGSTETSEEETTTKIDVANEDISVSRAHAQKLSGKLVFSAPLPVQMEHRSGSTRTKAVKL